LRALWSGEQARLKNSSFFTITQTIFALIGILIASFRQGQFTSAHFKALAILNDNHVRYLAEQVIPCFGEFDGQGRPVIYKVDILINDANYSSGVIEIDGDIHKKLSKETKDTLRDHRLAMQRLWVEHIPNDQIGTIMQILERHKRRIDDYGGVY
jgi:very-short-patch-repair endonuclease